MSTQQANSNCWLRPFSVQKELELLFDDISKRLSLYYGDNTSDREEHLESRLVTLVENYHLNQIQERIAVERRKKNLIPLTLQIKFKHITSAERQHGADMGFVTRISIPGEMELTKAVLVQGKKLFGNKGAFTASSNYPELFKKTEEGASPQWDRMLDVSAHSVYIFYNPDRLSIDKSVKDLGIRIITAQVVKGLHQAGRENFTAKDAYDLGKPFGSWMVNDFLCCTSGDTNEAAISVALGNNANFPVRHVFEIGIFADRDFDRSLFSQS